MPSARPAAATLARRGCQASSRSRARAIQLAAPATPRSHPQCDHQTRRASRCSFFSTSPTTDQASSQSASKPVPEPASTPSTSSYVDPSEISHFDALASSWWDPYGPSRVLHLMNPLRHDFIRSCRASSWTPPPIPTTTTTTRGGGEGKEETTVSRSGLRYLDVGCGGGIFAESAARLAGTASVTAVDPSARVLAVARAHARRDPALAGSKLVYRQGSVDEALGEPRDGEEEALFDVVTVFEVVEHVEYPAEFLDRCGRFVRPGGWLVLSTVARTWTSWFVTNFVAEDVLGMVPRGTHDWRKYINEEEMCAHFAKRPGWGPPRVMGVVYVPGLGWKEVPGSEKLVNYFFGVQRDPHGELGR